MKQQPWRDEQPTNAITCSTENQRGEPLPTSFELSINYHEYMKEEFSHG